MAGNKLVFLWIAPSADYAHLAADLGHPAANEGDGDRARTVLRRLVSEKLSPIFRLGDGGLGLLALRPLPDLDPARPARPPDSVPRGVCGRKSPDFDDDVAG